MMAALGSDAQGTNYCSACFTGVYPIPLRSEAGALAGEERKLAMLPVIP